MYLMCVCVCVRLWVAMTEVIWHNSENTLSLSLSLSLSPSLSLTHTHTPDTGGSIKGVKQTQTIHKTNTLKQMKCFLRVSTWPSPEICSLRGSS